MLICRNVATVSCQYIDFEIQKQRQCNICWNAH